MSRIVVALGGNALGETYLEQQTLIEQASHKLIKLFEGNEVVIVHGNGPQVGMIMKSLSNSGIEMPLDCCTAMSEGYIGFHIQKKLKKVLEKEDVDRDVITLLTEVVVDHSDKSFKNPTKPIGKFYSKAEAEKLSNETGDIYAEDSNRGYRKVVASPKPVDIKNIKSILDLIEDGTIVIACGGGGIPIYYHRKAKKVEAVIDKDLAASLLAKKINADKLIILTAVNQVKTNFGTEKEESIDEMSIEKAKEHIKNNEFKKGSMLPKVEAAIDFVEFSSKEAIITGLSNIDGILQNKNITIIHK